MCQCRDIKYTRGGYQVQIGLSPTPTSSLNPSPGVKKYPFKLQPTGWRSTKMSKVHFWYDIFWLWSDAKNNRTAFAKVPNEWMQIEHNMCGRRAAWSQLWWWLCFSQLVLIPLSLWALLSNKQFSQFDVDPVILCFIWKVVTVIIFAEPWN